MALTIVAYLPQPQRRQVRKVQRILSKEFNTHAALDWKPHVSIAGRVPKKNLSKIVREVREICKRTKSIEIHTFSLYAAKVEGLRFKSPYIIVIPVLPNLALHELRSKISKVLLKYTNEPKHYPFHITLSYKDISADNFEKARAYLEKHPINLKPFETDNIHIVIFDGKKWKSFKKFSLGA